jgi:hypothetical protein
VLESKLPRPAARIAGIGVRALSAVRDLVSDHRGVQPREIDRFDASHDALWSRMAADVTCAVVRDSSYLNWKYVDQPGQSFVRLEISLGDSVTGVAVLMFREPDTRFRYRRAFLVDIVAPLSNSAVLEQVVHAVIRAAADRQADALLCHHMNANLTRALGACGFRMRRPTRYLVVSAESLPESVRQQVTSAEGWLLTQGDSDIDRPGQ